MDDGTRSIACPAGSRSGGEQATDRLRVAAEGSRGPRGRLPDGGEAARVRPLKQGVVIGRAGAEPVLSDASGSEPAGGYPLPIETLTAALTIC